MMSKAHKLSPENYIRTRARTLPIYKCLVTPGWEETGIANVIVMRKHVNGNCTVGLYLVDLMCLGIKDTFYLFNEPEEDVNEQFNIGVDFFIETDYQTAHNIVYAGHDFAAEFDIAPAKEFEITKYILEEDDERIPVIDIPVGDEDGNPHLMVNSSYNYAPVLQKLKKNAGEGNYTFTIEEDDFGEDEDDDDDETFDDERDEDDINFDDELDPDEYDERLTDFQTVRDWDTDELMEELEEEESSVTMGIILRSELLWRKLKEEKPLSVLTDEQLEQTPDMISFKQNKPAWEAESDATADIREEVFEHIIEIQNKNLDYDKELDMFLQLMHKYRAVEPACVMILHSIGPMTMLAEFPKIKNALGNYSPAIKLALAAWDGFREDQYPELSGIAHAATLPDAFPGNTRLHAFHIKCFWLLKAIEALLQRDVRNAIYYHALIRTTGVGGHLKYLYALMLNAWLCEFLNIDEDDILFQKNE